MEPALRLESCYALTVPTLHPLTYPILSADQTVSLRPTRQRLTWPIDQLEIGQSFLIGMTHGRDDMGHHEDSVRALVIKFNKRLNRRFSCRKVDGGLLVIRTA